ncbi:MAG: phosphatidate cytidylyltransferase [Rhodospirillales bacterium]|nr:phosphatidate cytidylyltransferase [Rhodospirillales bacterium]MDH3917885.1 phosphatidate cytidylyltransferase [Rhodospirillales bacterium]MDH3966000.1 phosphatidate cytidylyltransferase [Rhodospirillales bacterium]
MRSVSSSNEIGDTVRRLVPVSAGNLTLRVVSALVLGPAVLALIYLGPPYFDILLTAVAAILTWEWSRLCSHGELDRPGYLAIAVVTAAMAAAGLREYMIAGWIIAAGAMAVAVLASRQTDRLPFWYVLGILYTALPCMTIVWLREHPNRGWEILFWMLFVVWSTDTGAYAAGRLIGGPKLAPGISPNKTWAGLVGGTIAAGAVGALAGLFLLGVSPITLVWVAAGLAVLSQMGDLFESSIKRRFGAKDSSNLIPGHGGLMDRLDGILAAGPAVALLVWVRGASL